MTEKTSLWDVIYWHYYVLRYKRHEEHGIPPSEMQGLVEIGKLEYDIINLLLGADRGTLDKVLSILKLAQ